MTAGSRRNGDDAVEAKKQDQQQKWKQLLSNIADDDVIA